MTRTATQPPPPEPAPSREQQILSAAARAFATQGYSAASMQDVAQLTGISKATLYHYFRSKEEMAETLHARTLDGLYRYVVAEAQSGPPAERVAAFMAAHARFFEANYHAFVALILDLSPTLHNIRPDAVSIRDRYENFLRDLLRDGVRAGEFRPTDPIVTGRAILSTLNWMIRWFKPGGESRAEDIARQYAELMLQGLKVERL